MLEAVLKRVLRAVFGGGADISAANPLLVSPTQYNPQIKARLPLFSLPKLARYKGNPVLIKGAPGAWDEMGVGEPCVIWDAVASIWKMWFYGYTAGGGSAFGYATSPDGITWTKYGGNPILTPIPASWESPCLTHNFCVRKLGNSDYRLWYESADAANVLRTGYATSPDGITWTRYAGNPILSDILDLGTNGVIIDADGYFHILGTPRREHPTVYTSIIQHFKSADGITWTKVKDINISNLLRDKTEVDCIGLLGLGGYYIMWWELHGAVGASGPYHDIPLFISTDLNHWDYLGTLFDDPYAIASGFTWMVQEVNITQGRGNDWRAYFGTNSNPGAAPEGAIGLAFLPYPRVPIVVLSEASIDVSTTTAHTACTEIPLEGAKNLAVTVECTFNALATQGIKVHVRSSADEINYDTEDFDSWIPNFTAGASVRQTKIYDPDCRYFKVLIENLDPARTVTNVRVTVSIGV